MTCPSEKIVLCPKCRVARQTNGKCPVCGEMIEPRDWPSIPFAEDLSPCSTQNLLPPEEGSLQYRLSPLASCVTDGELCTRFPYVFSFGKLEIRIGESSQTADVRIKGSASMHAALIKNKRTKTWWVYDCGGGTFVNGARVHCQELQDHDIVTVAGVALAFRGDRLESGMVSDLGVSLAVEGLCFATSERRILDNVTFAASPREFIGILGPSGCGKSSLVQQIAGLATSESGEIYVNGHLRDSVLDAFRATTAYLPQNVEQTLHEGLTVKEEIECFRRIHLQPAAKAEEDQETTSLLQSLGLLGRGEQIGDAKIGRVRIGRLSGGQKRRVGIALSLLRHAPLLLLDEPGAGLDPASESLAMQCFRSVANQGATVLCVTHVLANLQMFDKVLVLSKKGCVVYFGKSSELLKTFGATDFGVLYAQLEKDEIPQNDKALCADRTEAALPSVGEPSCLQRARGYFVRTFRDFFAPIVMTFSSEGRARKRFSALWKSARSVPAVLFVWQPLLLVVGIRLACAIGFKPEYYYVDLLGFCAALAMFWVGINNAARELVKERVPGRCLENLNHVPCSAYLFSKFLWTMFVCALQTLSFVVLLKLAAGIEIPLVAERQVSGFAMSVWWFFPLYVTCLVGAFLGLAISAVNKKSMSAISVVPNIAIFALLFSNVMIRFEKEGDYYVALAKRLACCTPCHWASKVLSDVQQKVELKVLWENLCPLLLVFAVSAVLSAVIVWVFQRRNEKAWNGRQ